MKEIKGFIIVGRSGGFKAFFKQKWRAEHYILEYNHDWELKKGSIYIK